MPDFEEIIDFDFDAQKAQLKEAAGKFTSVKFRGERLLFPPPKLWTQAAMKALNEADFLQWLFEVLDESVVEKITADEEVLPYEAEALCDAIMKKNGLDSGKSVPSSGPPNKKRKR